MNALNSQTISPSGRSGLLLGNYITVNAAAELTGYNPQYLRRLLHFGKLNAVKVGQVWLIELVALTAYVQGVQSAQDRRFGPHGLSLA